MHKALLTVLIGGLVLAGCTDGGDTGTTGERPATSGPETGELLVHGVVRDDGQPVEDATVQVQIWADGAGQEVGEVVDTFETEPTRTGSDGDYFVDLDPDRLPSKYFGGADFVNFDLIVSIGDRVATWSTTAWLLEKDGVWRSDGARSGDETIDVSVDLMSGQVTMTDSVGEKTRHHIQVSDLSDG